MAQQIDTVETTDKNVQFKIDPIAAPFYKVEYSLTIEVDNTNPIHNALIEKVNDKTLTDDVEFIALVFLTELLTVPSGPAKNPNPIHPINYMYSKNPTDSNGLIISMTEEMSFIHKPRRTKGKVSNSLG